jgi:hypothetical protein
MVGSFIGSWISLAVGDEIMSAETDRQENFDSQFMDFTERHPHYATAGCKRYYKRAVKGYVILAVACIVGIFAVSARSDKNLRHDINQLGVAGCLTSIKTYHKFNDQIDTQIETQKEGLIINLQRHDKQRAAVNRNAIKRLNKDKIIPPTPKICNATVLLK